MDDWEVFDPVGSGGANGFTSVAEGYAEWTMSMEGSVEGYPRVEEIIAVLEELIEGGEE